MWLGSSIPIKMMFRITLSAHKLILTDILAYEVEAPAAAWLTRSRGCASSPAQ